LCLCRSPVAAGIITGTTTTGAKADGVSQAIARRYNSPGLRPKGMSRRREAAPSGTTFPRPFRRGSCSISVAADFAHAGDHKKPPSEVKDTVVLERHPLHQLRTRLPASISVKEVGPSSTACRHVGHSKLTSFPSRLRLRTLRGSWSPRSMWVMKLGRLVAVELAPLELPGCETSDVDVELVEAWVVAIAGELDLEL
jgi:hypothetical protein